MSICPTWKFDYQYSTGKVPHSHACSDGKSATTLHCKFLYHEFDRLARSDSNRGLIGGFDNVSCCWRWGAQQQKQLPANSKLNENNTATDGRIS